MAFVDLGARSFAILGGGLVGCLLGVYLRKRGYTVAFYESRGDPRAAMERGRSINVRSRQQKIEALCDARFVCLSE